MPLLTKTEYAVLTRAESEAKATLGMHTGGPHEQEYRDFLKSLRRVMLKVKRAESVSSVSYIWQTPQTDD